MSATTNYVPKVEATLDEYVHNFDERIAAMPTAFGLVAAQATAFHTLVLAWDAAYAVTKFKSTRSGSAVIVKNEKKAAMVADLRSLVKIIQAFPGTTDEQRSLLGITIPKQRARRPIPQIAPSVQRESVGSNNSVRIRLYDPATPARRGLPAGLKAVVFSYVGAQPPTNPEDWLWQGTATRATSVDVNFSGSLPAGTKVFICAAYQNERGQCGPAGTPIWANLANDGIAPVTAQQGDSVKLAA